MNYLKSAFFCLILLLAALTVTADVATKLKSLANGGEAKVVWARSTDLRGWGNISQPTSARNCILMGFDADEGVETVIDDSLHNIIRPLISHDGSRVVWSSGDTGAVYIINWDGSGKRKLADGIAGALWYDSNTEEEYVLYAPDCILFQSYAQTGFPIYRLNLDDPSDTLMLLDPETHDYDRIQPYFMSTTSDGEYIVTMFGWPKIAAIKWKDNLPGGVDGGCWPSMPYDDTHRLVVFNDDHTGLRIKSRTTNELWLCPAVGETHPKCGVDHPRMSSWDPTLFCYIKENNGESTGPGNIIIAKVTREITSIEKEVTVTSGFEDGWPDAWLRARPKNEMLEITSPTGGESWPAGSEQIVTWTTNSDEIPFIAASVSYDSGATFNHLKSSSNTNTMTITLPEGLASENAMLMIKNPVDAEMADTSELFTISDNTPPSVTITSPAGGEQWLKNTQESITWESTNVESLSIRLTTDNGDSWSTVVTTPAQTGLYALAVGETETSNQCRIIISSVSDQTIADTSQLFSIIAPTSSSLVLTSPQAGDSWIQGLEATISWEAVLVDTIEFFLSTDNGVTWTKVGKSSAKVNSFTFQPSHAASDLCHLYIADAADPETADTTGAFNIVEPSTRSLSFIQPTADDVWTIGEQANISWATNGAIDSVALYLSIDNGSSWKSLGRMANSETHTITIADSLAADSCQLRLDAIDDATISDTSDMFSIRNQAVVPAPVAFISPADTTIWAWNITQLIKWTAPDSISEIMLSISLDGGESWVASVRTENDGEYELDIKGHLRVESDSCLLKIQAPGLGSFLSEYFAIASVGVNDKKHPARARVFKCAAIHENQLRLEIALSEATPITVSLFTMTGRRIAEFALPRQAAGFRTLNLHKPGISLNGAHIAIIQAGALTSKQRIHFAR